MAEVSTATLQPKCVTPLEARGQNRDGGALFLTERAPTVEPHSYFILRGCGEGGQLNRAGAVLQMPFRDKPGASAPRVKAGGGWEGEPGFRVTAVTP